MKLLNRTHLRYIVISCFFLAISTGNAQNEKGVIIDKIVAKVDDYIILKSELEQAYLDYLSRGEVSGTNAKCDILQQLVVNKMLVAQAEIDSVTILDGEVNANLDRRMSVMIQQFGGESEIERAYGKTLEQIRSEVFDNIKEQMTIQRMQSELTSSIKVTPSEVRKFFKNIPSDSLPYFPTEVSVAQIVKDVKPGKLQKDKVKRLLVDIRQRIIDGEPFGTLARLYSQDPGSAARGGELSFFGRGELAPEFEATALSLKPGEISMPVETKFGFHIIELLEKRGNTYNSRHILIRPQPNEKDFEKASRELSKLREQILQDSITFQSAAKELSDDQLTSSAGGFFQDPSGSLKVASDQLDPNIFFTIDTMSIGNITQPLKFKKQNGESAYRILYYKDRIPPHQANLDDDYQKIAAAALTQKQNRAVAQWFEKARNNVYIEIDPEYDICDLQN